MFTSRYPFTFALAVLFCGHPIVRLISPRHVEDLEVGRAACEEGHLPGQRHNGMGKS